MSNKNKDTNIDPLGRMNEFESNWGTRLRPPKISRNSSQAQKAAKEAVLAGLSEKEFLQTRLLSYANQLHTSITPPLDLETFLQEKSLSYDLHFAQKAGEYHVERIRKNLLKDAEEEEER